MEERKSQENKCHEKTPNLKILKNEHFKWRKIQISPQSPFCD